MGLYRRRRTRWSTRRWGILARYPLRCRPARGHQVGDETDELAHRRVVAVTRDAVEYRRNTVSDQVVPQRLAVDQSGVVGLNTFEESVVAEAVDDSEHDGLREQVTQGELHWTCSALPERPAGTGASSIGAPGAAPQ